MSDMMPGKADSKRRTLCLQDMTCHNCLYRLPSVGESIHECRIFKGKPLQVYYRGECRAYEKEDPDQFPVY